MIRESALLDDLELETWDPAYTGPAVTNYAPRPRAVAIGPDPQTDKWGGQDLPGDGTITIDTSAPIVAGIPGLDGVTTAACHHVTRSGSSTPYLGSIWPSGYRTSAGIQPAEKPAPVVPGTSYRILAVVASNKDLDLYATATYSRLFWQFFNASGSPVGSLEAGTPTKYDANTPTLLSATVTAPAGATQLRLMVQHRINATDDPVGFKFWTYAIWLVRTGDLETYFDGDTPDAVEPGGYLTAWTGPVHASPSTRTPLADWQPWLGAARSVKVTRGGKRRGISESVDVGTLNVTLVDAGDPLEDASLRPNLPIRLRLDDGALLFTGRVLDLDTRYELDKSTGTTTTFVTISAVDAVATHQAVTRYGAVTDGGVGFESWAQRIIRLAGSSLAPIEPPADDTPVVIWGL